MTSTYSARTAPFQPETVWTLEDGALVETRGERVRRLPLARLTRFRLAAPDKGARRRLLDLRFGREKIAIGSQSYKAPGIFEDRLDSFSPFVRELAGVAAEASGARFTLARIEARPALTAVIGLLSVGALVVLASSLSAGMAAVGIDMAARMAFLLILLLAVLPWLSKGDAFDPFDPPHDLLP